MIGALTAILWPLTRTILADDLPSEVTWSTVVNNLDKIPDAGLEVVFNSYNQPSINANGHVVLRARSKGPNPVSGIYERDLLGAGGPLAKIADRSSKVPDPNYDSAMFNEFPSIPRIAMWSNTSATRGNSTPVWTYQLEDGSDTKIGTNGIYIHRDNELITGIGLLGAVPKPLLDPVLGGNYFPYMAVPDVDPATRFDVFPGSPALSDDGWIVFKGNYTENGDGKTGVFCRNPNPIEGDIQFTFRLASTSTAIPNLPVGVSGVNFGSTAPPSAAGFYAVFAGFDNEASPTYGGIYLAELKPNAPLATLVGIGDPVPGETSATFNRFGEALSFDGRYVAFWGAWGEDVIPLHLDCPADGNKDVLAYCMELYPDGFDTSVPANQGIFVIDTYINPQTGTYTLHRVARTGEKIADFVYWNFSGKPPGVGGGDEGDGELPRWRSTSFLAVSGGPNDTFTVAFKSRSMDVDSNPVDAICLADADSIDTLVDTTMNGQELDPLAPVGSKISALGIEREGLRGNWLAITAAMLEPVSGESMAGIYVSRIFTTLAGADLPQGTYLPEPQPVAANKPRIISVKVSSKSQVAGKLSVNGKIYPVKGVFNKDGIATNTIQLKEGSLLVTLKAIEMRGVPMIDLAVTGGEANYSGLAVLTPKK